MLSFGDFSLHEQRKVTRSPARRVEALLTPPIARLHHQSLRIRHSDPVLGKYSCSVPKHESGLNNYATVRNLRNAVTQPESQVWNTAQGQARRQIAGRAARAECHDLISPVESLSCSSPPISNDRLRAFQLRSRARSNRHHHAPRRSRHSHHLARSRSVPSCHT